jgi:hypothetical protein
VLLLGRRFAEFPAIFAGYHALVLILLLAGWRLGTERGRELRVAAAIALFVVFTTWEYPHRIPLFANAAWALHFWYPTTLLALTAALAYLQREKAFGVAAVAMIAFSGIVHGVRGYRSLKLHVVGLDAISVGLAFLAAGIAVSLVKARRERKARDSLTS